MSGLVVVTGAAGGIGSAIAEDLRSEGHRVMGVDLRAAHEDDTIVDLGTPDCGEQLADEIGSQPVIGLVNNAARASFLPVAEADADEWDRVHSVSLRAPYLVSRALVPALVRGSGAIVNVSSVHARATSPGAVAYAAAKGGLSALTRALALEFAEASIRVNSVAPGAIDTRMLRQSLERGNSTIDEMGRRHPVGRVGHTSEIASVVRFLLFDGGARFMTGAEIVVDGGATARLSTE